MVNIISLSINQFYAESNLPGKNYGDLEFMKSMLFVNYFKKELLPSSSDKLGEIIVYNPESTQSYYRNTMDKFDEFRDRMNLKGKTLTFDENNIEGIENVALYNLDANVRAFSGPEKSEIESLFGDTDLNTADFSRLMEIQRGFLDLYKDYKTKLMTPELNFTDPKEVLYALLQSAIIAKSGMDLAGDFQNMSKYSCGFSDFKSLMAALYTHDQAEYDKLGRKIQGLTGGLAFATPDNVRSRDLRNINKIISTGNAHIGEKMVKESELIHELTNKYYADSNFSKFDQNVIGNTQDIHSNL